jgi:nitrogen-specific signal transduction histidine kinase
MSCALLSDPAHRAISLDAQVIGQFAEGLHGMAQPLTILRGAVGALQLSSRVGPEDRRYVEMCVTQTDRLCALLSRVRDLLDSAQVGEAGNCGQVDAEVTSD